MFIIMELILEIIQAFFTTNIMLALFSIFYVAPFSTVVFAVINLAKFTSVKKKYDSSTEPAVAEEYKKEGCISSSRSLLPSL